MTDTIHSCSYFCDRPDCINAQRDELRNIIISEAPRLAALEAENADLRRDAERYRELNTPEMANFIVAVEREALHQRDRWGAEGDAGKTDADWFWLIGYLAGKAINKPEKQLHHIITTAAACLNWHGARTGNYTAMRPGTAAPKENP